MDAGSPVVSDIRFAARPVGAASTMLSFAADARRTISETTVVLPTPGPPVMIENADAPAVSTARSCSPLNLESGGVLKFRTA